MTIDEATVGTRVRSLQAFADVPRGTEAVIDEDYGTGVMIAWDLPDRPLPKHGYFEHDGLWCWSGYPQGAGLYRLLRDGFDKKRELGFLEVVR